MDANQTTNNNDIAARREARRRKILENSKSRLSKIAGREHTDDGDIKSNSMYFKSFAMCAKFSLVFHSPTGTQFASQSDEQVQTIYPDPEIERDVYVPPPTTAPFPPELFSGVDGIGSFDDQKQFLELFNSLNQQQQQQQSGNSGINANTFAAFAQFGNNFEGSAGPNMFFSNLNSGESPKVPETALQKLLSTKIHIALLAIFTYLLNSLAPFHLNVFLIFLAWEVAEIFILRQHESSSNSIVNVLFMLVGISPSKMNVLLKWIQLLNKVLRDVALFMFVFIFTHICRSCWFGLSVVPLAENNESNYQPVNIPTAMEDDVFEQFDL